MPRVAVMIRIGGGGRERYRRDRVPIRSVRGGKRDREREWPLPVTDWWRNDPDGSWRTATTYDLNQG
jgi:hypothetical protein